MNDICEGLCTNTNEYDVDTTIKITEDYIKNEYKVDRIVGSEMSVMARNYSALDVARYVINYSNKNDYDISNLKLQKVLYLIQAYFLISTRNGRPCFDDEIEAWDFGPVVPSVYREFKQYGSANIPTIKSYIVIDEDNIWNSKRIEYDDSIIKDKHKKRINTVIERFSNYTATALVSLTHNQLPWIKAHEMGKNQEITIESLKEYFSG